MTSIVQLKEIEEWLPLRDDILDQLLLLEGSRPAGSNPCSRCREQDALFRCISCFGGKVYCSSCVVLMHESSPFHFIEVNKHAQYS